MNLPIQNLLWLSVSLGMLSLTLSVASLFLFVLTIHTKKKKFATLIVYNQFLITLTFVSFFITGRFWAIQAWSTGFSWDPKETGWVVTIGILVITTIFLIIQKSPHNDFKILPPVTLLIQILAMLLPGVIGSTIKLLPQEQSLYGIIGFLACYLTFVGSIYFIDRQKDMEKKAA